MFKVPDKPSVTRAFLAEARQILKACPGSVILCSPAGHGQLFLGFPELGQLLSSHLHLTQGFLFLSFKKASFSDLKLEER